MAEYILRPRNCRAISGYGDDDPNHPLVNAYDTNKNTFWRQKKSISYDDYYRTFYNFDFSSIPSNENIISMKIGCKRSTLSTHSGSTGIVFYAVNTLKTSYPSGSETIEKTLPTYRRFNTSSTPTDSQSDELPDSVIYCNENKNDIVAGNKIYGLYYEGSLYDQIDLYDVYLVVATEDESTKFFLCETPVTKAYLGNTPLTGIYLGNTKLL